MVTALGACLVRRDPQRYLAFYLVELSLLVSLFLFGRFDVTRLYLIFIPFVVISAVLLSCSKNTGTSQDLDFKSVIRSELNVTKKIQEKSSTLSPHKATTY